MSLPFKYHFTDYDHFVKFDEFQGLFRDFTGTILKNLLNLRALFNIIIAFTIVISFYDIFFYYKQLN